MATFTTLYRLPDNLYCERNPVIIKKGALLKVNATGDILVQLRMMNLGKKKIIAVILKVTTYSVTGELIDEEKEFQYLDLKAYQYQSFGSQIPIYLQNKNVRKFEVYVSEVVFEDGTSHKTGSNDIWDFLPKQKKLIDVYSPMMVIEFCNATGGKSNLIEYIPYIHLNLWQCACGSTNNDYEVRCWNCSSAKDRLFKLDEKTLNMYRSERIRREAEEEERKKEEDRIKKEELRSKTISLINKIRQPARDAAILIALHIFLTFILSNLYPVVVYNIGKYMYDLGNYASAIEHFDDAEKYKDSEMMMEVSKYYYAFELSDSHKYDEALDIFRYLSSGTGGDERRVYPEAVDALNQTLQRAVTYSKRNNEYGKVYEYEYEYITLNQNADNYTTYTYLKDLIASGKPVYSDYAYETYDNLFAYICEIDAEELQTDGKATLRLTIEFSGGNPKDADIMSIKILKDEYNQAIKSYTEPVWENEVLLIEDSFPVGETKEYVFDLNKEVFNERFRVIEEVHTGGICGEVTIKNKTESFGGGYRTYSFYY